jgi:biopolymer transport protein ExbD
MKFAGHKRRRAPTVIIVSLIDVLLVVLIFLMVTTTFKKMEPALKLILPRADQAKMGATDTKAFVILVSTNYPFYYLDNLPVTFDRLQKALVASAQRNPQVRVDIKADKASPFGEFIRVFNAAKEAQVGSINVITEKGRNP